MLKLNFASYCLVTKNDLVVEAVQMADRGIDEIQQCLHTLPTAAALGFMSPDLCGIRQPFLCLLPLSRA